jgi:hypothetical protein
VIRITVAHGEKDYQVLLKERLSKMPAATKDHNRKYEAIEKLLLAQKAHLTKQVNGRVNETMLPVTDSLSRGMSMPRKRSATTKKAIRNAEIKIGWQESSKKEGQSRREKASRPEEATDSRRRSIFCRRRSTGGRSRSTAFAFHDE